MAAPKQEQTIDDEDGRTNSTQACLLLEIATILSLAKYDAVQLGQSLGISNSQVAEIDASLEDPKNKVLHLLERFRDRHADDWPDKLQEAVREILKDADLAQEIGDINLTKPPKSPITPNGVEPIGQSQPSIGHSSEWEMMTGGAARCSDQETDQSSASYEQLTEESFFALREGKPAAKAEDEHHGSLDQPEMSIQIAKVGEALTVASDLLGNVEGISQLSQVIPQILQLVRQMKSQKMLRLVFEEENANLKQDLLKANEVIEDLRKNLEKAEAELLELKKTTEDKSLKDFDYVTKKEAEDIKAEQKQVQEKKQTSTSQATNQPPSNEGISVEAYENLQKKIIVLKQKLAQVVKLNHSWDEQYHRMESALKQEHEQARVQAEKQKAEWERREKEGQEALTAAKRAFDKAQAEKTSLQIAMDRAEKQVLKMTRYAQSLQGHKQDLETEVKRLNEALEQRLQVKEKASSGAMAAGQGQGVARQQEGGRQELVSHDERSLLESMSQDTLIEELGILKQQVDIYRSDFFKEQRDRQRAMGELDEVKTELYRTKRKMEKQKKEYQIMQDQTLAYKYQAKLHDRSKPPAPSQSKPTRKPQQTANVYARQQPPRPSKPTQQQQQQQKLRRPSDDELVPHGGAANYAMNDEYIDYLDPNQVFYPPDSDISEYLPQRQQEREGDPFYEDIF